MIKLCSTAGFCFGVARAVKLAEEAAESEECAVTLGEIIHNSDVVNMLEEKNVVPINTLDEIPKNATVIIRSHGVGEDVYEYLKQNDVKYIDATCPYVAKIHNIAKEHSNSGFTLFLAGDENHPEVKGIIGHYSGDYIIFENDEALSQIVAKTPNINQKTPVIMAQTTFNLEFWEKCKKILKKVYTNPKIFDTICSATIKRQSEAKSVSEKTDLMIVVGGRHSSNTKKLKQICEQNCECFLVENAKELKDIDFSNFSYIGITAGASTPPWIIKEVHETMNDFINNQEEEMSFEEMLEASFKSTYNGEKVMAVVTGIAPTEISVDIGTKHAGYVPLGELTDDPNLKPEDIVKVGDQIELLVVRVNDVDGMVTLSKKRLDAIVGFEKVMEGAETGEIFEGVITDVVKGGVLAATSGVKVFIPVSQISLSRVEDLNPFLKKAVSFKILEVNRQRRRAVGSVKAVLKEERKVLEDKFWESIEVGKVYSGVVKSLTDFGAFIDLGGVDGMVHISELSWSKIKHPSQVVKVGDMLEVYIKDIDEEKRKISLGYKKNEDNPWEILKTKYEVGDVAEVKVVSMTAFGAFAQLIPGVDGLIHISQIALERIVKPSDVLSVGQEVNAKITEIDYEAKRISLSVKALLEAERMDAQEAEEAAVEEATTEEVAPEAE